MSSMAAAPKPWADPRSRATILDAALATAVLIGSLTQLAHGGIGSMRPGSVFGGSHAGSGELDLIGLALALGTALPLLAWRRFTYAVFMVTAGSSVLLAALDYPLDLTLGAAAALYLLAASQPAIPWSRRTTITVTGLLVAYLGAAAAAQAAFPASELVHSGLAWAVAWFAGERTRLLREHIADLHERARRTEREAERERLLAAAEERARIARDLHDSAGHAISVIAVRAGAARLRHHRDPDRSLSALEGIEELARQTADDIEHIVGTLREDRPANGAIPAPLGLAALDTLIARHATAGLDVTLDTSGGPRPLTGPVDQGAYRILQEALTNAARHGAGGAQITLAFGETAVDITVTNPAPADPAPPSPRSSGGHGLIGMHERATLLGGSLDAQRTNGTFRVHAHIPYESQPT